MKTLADLLWGDDNEGIDDGDVSLPNPDIEPMAMNYSCIIICCGFVCGGSSNPPCASAHLGGCA